MQELQFDHDGASLFAVEDGNGPTLVMLHGALASHLAALPMVASLSARYRIVAPDLRGSGRSRWGAALTFDRLADDLEALLDALGVERAFVGGVSSGSGVALRFALRRPERTLGLILVKPIYAGRERGYTKHQRATFERMDAVARRAPEEGVEVLRPLYAGLPAAIRDKALAMIEGFDPASVAATSRFIVSGEQPFASAADLRTVRPPTLLIRGDDPLHPAEVSDLYAANIPRCIAEAASPDVSPVIGAFCDRHRGSGGSVADESDPGGG